MWELLEGYRQVAHLAEWSGLSLGALAVCGLGIYLGLSNPRLLIVSIVAAINVACLYVGLMHGAAVTRADDKAQFDAEKAAMAAAAVKRDQTAATATAKQYDPISAQIAADELARNNLVKTDVPHPGACRLTDAAFRVRSAAAKPAKQRGAGAAAR